MELLQLKYFCDAAETQNFSKTAKKFFVPTSNISQSIKRLETELKVPLFERSSNKVKLNESGLAFYKNAKSALDLLENAKRALESKPSAKVIKANIHINRRIVMGIIEKFRRQHPEINFITTHTTDESFGEFDIIVTDKDLDLSYLKSQAAQEELLVAYNKYAFSFDDEITAADLENSPFITMGSGNSIHESTKKICNDLGFEPHIALQSEDPFYIRKCIELGLGISIVPELSWRGQFSEQVVLKKIGDYKRKIFVYKKHGMDEYINKFNNMLIDEFNSQSVRFAIQTSTIDIREA